MSEAMTDRGPPLRLLQLITDCDRRGAQIFAVDLAEGLRALGAVVETVALEPGSQADRLPVSVLGRRRLGLSTLKQLRRVARHHDVVLAHGSSALPASALGLVGLDVPIVYRQISDPEVWASTWARRLRVAIFLRRMSGLVALSAGTSSSLKRHYWIKESPPITVIPNAVAAGRFRPPSGQERSEARSLLGVPDTSDTVLVIGALVPEKAVDLAIEAIAGLDPVLLLVAGDGIERAELEALASERMVDRCRFLGALADTRVAYWAADMLVLPSRSESMPAVLIEAGLCGLPSVTTDVGATSEVIDHGVTGFVVPPGDGAALASGVARLIHDPTTRQAMGAAAADRCSARFTIDRTAPSWFDLLSDLVTAAGGRPARRAPRRHRPE